LLVHFFFWGRRRDLLPSTNHQPVQQTLEFSYLIK
jgi:hypothetical protein